MNGIQSWAFLLLLCAVAARGLGGVRFERTDLGAMGAAVAVAIAQRLFIDQVALDDPWFSPVLLALPLVAATRGGVRDGVAAAVGTWLALTVVGAAMPAAVAGELPQEGYVLATVFAALTAGAAGSLSPARRHLGPLFGLAWLAFFLVRDAWLGTSAGVLGVTTLSVAWGFAGVYALGPRSGSS